MSEWEGVEERPPTFFENAGFETEFGKEPRLKGF